MGKWKKYIKKIPTYIKKTVISDTIIQCCKRIFMFEKSYCDWQAETVKVNVYT